MTAPKTAPARPAWWRQLGTWRRARFAAAGAGAVAAAAAVGSVNGMIIDGGAPWWSLAVLAAGAVLTGLVLGSYVRAPIGAEATLCDTRWPLIGLTGLVLATSTGPDTLATHLFTGAAPWVLAGMIQPAFAILSLGLLGWALRERLALERWAMAPPDDGNPAGACATCRPLFPTRSAP
ncbi:MULTISPECIES: hypothetical protein [Arthrobacter]|uniref:Uncharacterized protein n=1 Tax=Arthrobacter oryzae TaxID=409290 RepID=A0A3N0BUE3_9MICC|nr:MULTISPECIES: hypothetical protein [Arthrobacter]QYF90341.1 hypothetical protein KY499_03160 [Arthrobacter sp. PAMC25284]RNL52950.1 hypothetical protein D7003_13290 [Arthrobacter oryzae]